MIVKMMSSHHEAQMMRSLALDRRKQINTLLIFNENVSEVSPNQSYRVDFTVGAGGDLALVMIIDLPPKFPAHGSRPLIRVEAKAGGGGGGGLRHAWLEPETGNVVGAPGLLSYGPHSDLGRVVQAIKRTLEKDPPTTVADLHSGLCFIGICIYLVLQAFFGRSSQNSREKNSNFQKFSLKYHWYPTGGFEAPRRGFDEQK